MNKQRRKDITQAINSLMEIDLVSIQDAIQMIVDDEQQSLDDLPENLQESDRANTMQEAIDSLESACETVNNIETEISECFDYLEQAMGEV
jgi:gamma-glutamyl:cysteine ligase YbdK (ATP-grasp superfamily)